MSVSIASYIIQSPQHINYFYDTSLFNTNSCSASRVTNIESRENTDATLVLNLISDIFVDLMAKHHVYRPHFERPP